MENQKYASGINKLLKSKGINKPLRKSLISDFGGAKKASKNFGKFLNHVSDITGVKFKLRNQYHNEELDFDSDLNMNGKCWHTAEDL